MQLQHRSLLDNYFTLLYTKATLIHNIFVFNYQLNTNMLWMSAILLLYTDWFISCYILTECNYSLIPLQDFRQECSEKTLRKTLPTLKVSPHYWSTSFVSKLLLYFILIYINCWWSLYIGLICSLFWAYVIHYL